MSGMAGDQRDFPADEDTRPFVQMIDIGPGPFTRSTTLDIVEIVPERGMLPDCQAWKADGAQCDYPARYTQNMRPVCGVHVGRPGTIFIPIRRR